MGTTKFQEKKKKEQETEAKIQHALTCRKKALAEIKRLNKKKKTVAELLARLSLKGLLFQSLRTADTYVPRSCNLDKQLYGLINHLFVQYPVPLFLYAVCFNERAETQHKQWFITLAQGGSFPKAVKGTLNSKEAFAFLSAPNDRTIHENIWWARLKIAGVSGAMIGALIDRVFARLATEDKDGRLAEAVQFYARHGEALTRRSWDEVTDFVAYKLRNDPQFRLKGRTAASMVKLTDEWHLLMQRAKLGKHIQWAGLQVADWTYENKAEVWDVLELKDNKELVNEGRKQKHCVYSYVPRCVEGRSFIFSLRACRKLAADYTEEGKPIWSREFETRRVTIEVNASRCIVQVRGPLNRPPSPEEQQVLRRWMGERGIQVASRS